MGFLLTFLSSLGVVGFLILGVIIFLYLKQRAAEANTIPPLDLVDAKKLDTMISAKVEIALRPLLLELGFSDEEIEEALVRTSAVSPKFRR